MQLRKIKEKPFPVKFYWYRDMEQFTIDELYISDEEEFPPLKLIDTHCHPHDDDRKLNKIAKLKTYRVCIMGVNESDWSTVLKVI
jgi:hypothetical protein